MGSEAGTLFAMIHEMLETKKDISDIQEYVWDLHSRTSAVVVIDIKGSTRLFREIGLIRYLCGLANLRNSVNALLDRYKASSVKFEGDKVYAEMFSVDQAYTLATMLFKEIDERKIDFTPEVPMVLSIGIGFGRIVGSPEEGIFGDQVNLAVKLGEDIGSDGEILVTNTAYHWLTSTYQKNFKKHCTCINAVDIHYYSKNLAS